MKKNDVELGATYVAKVSGKQVHQTFMYRLLIESAR